MDEGFEPHVLICATLWWATSARLAMAFRHHGCSVSAVCPPGHPIRFITGVRSIYPYRSLAPVDSLLTAIRAAKPMIIVPCDEAAVWQLHAIYENHPDLRPLIEFSLGAPEAYATTQKRGEILRVARELGIRVPLTQTVHSVEELQNWCFDSPAVLKLDGTWGGEGVTIVSSLAEAIAGLHSTRGAAKASVAWKRFLINRRAFALWFRQRRKSSEITIQKFIHGRPATTMFACWQGEVLASCTVEVLNSQGVTGAATVVRVLQNDEIENAAQLLARRFRLSGFHGLDFMLEDGTDAAFMIELNPRATQLGHLNVSSRGPLAGALAAKLRDGAAYNAAPEDRIQHDIIAFFPNAFKSKAKSTYLTQGHHDVPWGEPALVRELLRDPWPDRRLLSRIYRSLRLPSPKRPDPKPWLDIQAVQEE